MKLSHCMVVVSWGCSPTDMELKQCGHLCYLPPRTKPMFCLPRPWLENGFQTLQGVRVRLWGPDSTPPLQRHGTWLKLASTRWMTSRSFSSKISWKCRFMFCDFWTSRLAWNKDVETDIIWDTFGYPLVNIQKTMENHHFQWVNPL